MVLTFIFVVAWQYIQEKNDALTLEHALDKPSTMNIESIIFKNNERIPAQYTCDGSNINPSLTISGVPAEAKSLALIMNDPDSPTGTWVHWTVWNMDPMLKTIDENTVPKGVEGKTSFGASGYGGPCPGSGEHHYHFKLYALDTILDLPAGSTLQVLETAMKGHTLAFAELIGLYKRT